MSSGAREHSRALLVRRTPYGNSSLVVHAITEHRGRIAVIAKGAYRPKSRYCGVLDWFDTLELGWRPPRASQRMGPERVPLGTLVEGDVQRRRRHVTRSLPAYVAAQTMVELLDVTTRAGFADHVIFALAEDGLDTLDAFAHGRDDSDTDPLTRGALASFELKLAKELGIAPALVRCAACGGPAEVIRDVDPPRAHFSAQSGGRLCARHAEEARAAGRRVGTLPLAVLERADALLRRPLAPDVQLEDPDGSALDFAARFLDHHLDVRTRSHRRLLTPQTSPATR